MRNILTKAEDYVWLTVENNSSKDSLLKQLLLLEHH